ncbi:hypothetical protein [Kitasatospora sp. NPDC093679]|uniref:hypothetical protein n=1 Tax=Kitasatospora sp. NPDC093679 TaxID=3154983 RepID=UPI003444193A
MTHDQTQIQAFVHRSHEAPDHPPAVLPKAPDRARTPPPPPAAPTPTNPPDAPARRPPQGPGPGQDATTSTGRSDTDQPT